MKHAYSHCLLIGLKRFDWCLALTRLRLWSDCQRYHWKWTGFRYSTSCSYVGLKLLLVVAFGSETCLCYSPIKELAPTYFAGQSFMSSRCFWLKAGTATNCWYYRHSRSSCSPRPSSPKARWGLAECPYLLVTRSDSCSLQDSKFSE